MILEKAYIYILTSPSGKKYIGQTVNLKKRFENYKNLRRTTQVKLAEAIKKYNWDTFSIETFEFNNIDEKELDRLEINYIREYDTFNNGYNCTIGGGGKRVHKTIEERKASRKISLLKYKFSNIEKVRISKLKYSQSERGRQKAHEAYIKRRENKKINDYK